MMSKAHRREEWYTGSKLVVLGCHKVSLLVVTARGVAALSDELPVRLATRCVSCHRGLPLYVVRDKMFSRQDYKGAWPFVVKTGSRTRLSDELPVGLSARFVSCHRGLPLFLLSCPWGLPLVV
jgi:hypothetical protein